VIDLAQIAIALNAGRPPRVWSLLVTVFGDLAQDEDAELSGSLLGHLTERLGVKPEAMRVALHRLRKDGWIESRRDGRASFYRLTANARAETQAASARIYDITEPPEAAWILVAKPGATLDWPPEGRQVAPTLFVTPEKETHPDCLSCPIEMPPPAWLSERLVEPSTVALTGAIEATLSRIPRTAMEPLDVAALRVAVIQAWRRVALRAPDLPDAMMPAGWRGPGCRKAVANLLQDYPRQPLSALPD
jgi:phenylacetic acid degradation operon negative regulatory protein